MSRLKKLDVRKPSVKEVRLGLAGLIVAAAVVVGAVSLLGGDSSKSSPGAGEAVALSESELLARASTLGQPAFWIGPRVGTESYELNSPSEGRVYIRYLTGGAKAGDPRPDFLTIGTYAVPDAQQALQKAVAESKGGQKLSQHAGYEVLSPREGNNAYVVFDNQPGVQVEIFSPQPGEAAQLAASGSVKPLG